MRRGVDYLVAQQSLDGSWQSTGSAARYVETAEAVLALQSNNVRSATYYSGIAWLGNHSVDNTDYRARRVLALAGNGSVVMPDVLAIQSALIENAYGLGWSGNGGYGLSGIYWGAPLDTVMVLLAFKSAGQAVGVPSVMSYLLAAQRTVDPKGWAVVSGGLFDAATTAQVLIGLSAYLPDASLTTPMTNAVGALKASVTSASPVRLRALSTLAYIKAMSATDAYVVGLLNSLVADQAQDGRWGSGVYDTALALRALAAAASKDLAADRTLVSVVDDKLRALINQQLGRNAMDQLNRGEMQLLTQLLVPSMGIINITGLEYASNLTRVDLSGNAIASLVPLAGINAQVSCQGNPGCIATSIAVAFSPRTLPVNRPITLKAVLTGGNTKGTVTFRRDGLVISENLPIDGQGVVTTQVTLPRGAYIIVAEYSGDYTHAPSTATVSLRVPNLNFMPIILE